MLSTKPKTAGCTDMAKQRLRATKRAEIASTSGCVLCSASKQLKASAVISGVSAKASKATARSLPLCGGSKLGLFATAFASVC